MKRKVLVWDVRDGRELDRLRRRRDQANDLAPGVVYKPEGSVGAIGNSPWIIIGCRILSDVARCSNSP
jgi:hypothetical protein